MTDDVTLTHVQNDAHVLLTIHVTGTQFILDCTTQAVVETTVIDKHVSGTSILFVEASFISAETGLHQAVVGQTSVKGFFSLWFLFANTEKGMQLFFLTLHFTLWNFFNNCGLEKKMESDPHWHLKEDF